MRWDNLRLDDTSGPDSDGAPPFTAPEQPLFPRGTVARTFDTPGFRGMTFYEIHARSIVSRVPEASKVPFRWTINPYRGCQHACAYCAEGSTPVLMADGSTRPLASLRVGDKVYGTVKDGSCRRYAVTTVLAHWSTVKPAHRITLEDGTRLIASGDHRFLTERGWKHVTGAEQGSARRPFLTVSNKLMGIGGFAAGPKDCVDYRRGYLCGLIRGHARLGSYSYAYGDVHQFRLALADLEPLARARRYLGATFAILTTEFDFTVAAGPRRPMRAIRTAVSSDVQAIRHLASWPGEPAGEWRKGFLAGIFDAEGSYSQGVWRVANTNEQILQWTQRALASFGFGFAVERSGHQNGMTHIRLRGGLREAMRFFHLTDPAITRKRSIDGAAIKGDARLQVASIEPLGLEIPMYDITTGTGDFIANGVVSHNCFARNSHTYLDLDAGQDFNSKVVVKVNAPELLRAKLASPRWRGEHIAMGTNVDCYQRAEGRYELMRPIIAALRDAANPFSILTKGTLILRDLDLLREAAEVTDVGLNVSAAFIDKSLWRAIEPGAPAPERRLEACAALNGSGLRCGVLMGPVVPYLSDSPAQLAAAVRQIAETGAAHVTPIVLHLRPGAREWFCSWLRTAHPELLPRYAELYERGAYAPRAYQARIAGQVRELAERYGVGRANPRGPASPRGVPRRDPGTVVPARAARPAGNEQLMLL